MYVVTKHMFLIIRPQRNSSRTDKYLNSNPYHQGNIVESLKKSIAFHIHPSIHLYTQMKCDRIYRNNCLQSVRDLRQVCDPWFLVNKLPLIQIPKLCSVETDPEVGTEHPLVALDEGKTCGGGCGVLQGVGVDLGFA